MNCSFYSKIHLQSSLYDVTPTKRPFWTARKIPECLFLMMTALWWLRSVWSTSSTHSADWDGLASEWTCFLRGSNPAEGRKKILKKKNLFFFLYWLNRIVVQTWTNIVRFSSGLQKCEVYFAPLNKGDIFHILAVFFCSVKIRFFTHRGICWWRRSCSIYSRYP